MSRKVKGFIIVTVIGIFGFATLSFACRGYGMGRDGRGPGWHHRGGYGHGMGRNIGNLSEDEIVKLDQQRSEFFKGTEGIRGELYEKELSLRSELAKENPDTTKASNLQSEISKLQSELDQKRLDFEIQNRKTMPGYKRGFRGNGPMMGYGRHGNGYCRW